MEETVQEDTSEPFPTLSILLPNQVQSTVDRLCSNFFVMAHLFKSISMIFEEHVEYEVVLTNCTVSRRGHSHPEMQ